MGKVRIERKQFSCSFKKSRSRKIKNGMFHGDRPECCSVKSNFVENIKAKSWLAYD